MPIFVLMGSDTMTLLGANTSNFAFVASAIKDIKVGIAFARCKKQA